MKKMVSLVLALMLMLSTCTAFAAEIILPGLATDKDVELLDIKKNDGIIEHICGAEPDALRAAIGGYMLYLTEDEKATVMQTFSKVMQGQYVEICCIDLPGDYPLGVVVNVDEKAYTVADLVLVRTQYETPVVYNGKKYLETISLIYNEAILEVRE